MKIFPFGAASNFSLYFFFHLSRTIRRTTCAVLFFSYSFFTEYTMFVFFIQNHDRMQFSHFFLFLSLTYFGVIFFVYAFHSFSTFHIIIIIRAMYGNVMECGYGTIVPPYIYIYIQCYCVLTMGHIAPENLIMKTYYQRLIPFNNVKPSSYALYMFFSFRRREEKNYM